MTPLQSPGRPLPRRNAPGPGRTRRARNPVRTAAAACLLLVLTACGRPGLAAPRDARPLDEPPVPPVAVDAARVPGVLGDRGLWTSPYSSEPKATDDGFVGLVADDGGGDLRFLGVDARGRTRWSTPRNPSCTGFTTTRGGLRPLHRAQGLGADRGTGHVGGPRPGLRTGLAHGHERGDRPQGRPGSGHRGGGGRRGGR
ncbi:hypothetical protein ACFW53_08305 [Nocardiopsis dassonvillei]|uniref:hypothetical protein n=1 Tax=Nocardiopsis dassonvillei TaxID=2014 RepID=UPI00366B0E9A